MNPVKNCGMLMLMTMIVLAVISCRVAYCRLYEACVIGVDGEPVCQCPDQSLCDDVEDQLICASNGQTYNNRCFLRVDECATNQPIRVLHRGACRQGTSGDRRRPVSRRQPTNSH